MASVKSEEPHYTMTSEPSSENTVTRDETTRTESSPDNVAVTVAGRPCIRIKHFKALCAGFISIMIGVVSAYILSKK